MKRKCLCFPGSNKDDQDLHLYVARRIAALYFGCNCDSNRIRWTISSLAITFNVGTTTVSNIIRRYRENRFQVVKKASRKGRTWRKFPLAM